MSAGPVPSPTSPTPPTSRTRSTTTSDTISDDAGEAPARRPGPDPLALVAGLAAILVAILALTGTIVSVDPRWVLALGAVGVGLGVLLATLRRR